MKVIFYLVALAVVLGGLFLVFKPEGAAPPRAEKNAPASAAPAASAPGTTAPLAAPATPGAAESTASTAAAAAAPQPATFDLVVKQGRLVSGPTVIQVHKDDEIVIRLTSDTADELHLHGYNLHLKLTPGETATLKLTASRTGRFTYELHHADAEIGALEVYPR